MFDANHAYTSTISYSLLEVARFQPFSLSSSFVALYQQVLSILSPSSTNLEIRHPATSQERYLYVPLADDNSRHRNRRKVNLSQ